MYPGIEFRLLRYVAVLAEELSFTRAAARLRVAQPSLSRQIRDVEDYLGVKLFERTKREVRLTAAGDAFSSEARQAILHAERAVEVARAANGAHKGPWNIAFSPLVDPRAMSKVRRYLTQSHSGTEIRFLSAFTSEQSAGLMSGKLQAGLVVLPVGEPQLRCEGLYREPLLLAMPEDHSLATKSAVEITDLHELPLISLRADIEPRFGNDLNRLLGLARTRPRILQEATTQAEALEMVFDGGTPALVTLSAGRSVREGIVFRRFVDDFLAAETGLAFLQNDRSDILKSLRGFLKQTFEPLTVSENNRGANGRERQLRLF